MAGPLIALLGPPLIVSASGTELPVRGSRKRALIELLAIRRGHAVPSEVLAEAAWGADPPRTAASALRVHLADLRRMLGEVGFADALPSTGRGYLLDVDETALDIGRLAAAGDEVRTTDDPARIEVITSEALGLWRSTPFVDLEHTDLALGEVGRLAQIRWELHEARIEAALAVGRGGEHIGWLEASLRHEPFREDIASLLMLALDQRGRSVEALAVYRATRAALGSELGLEPGERLREAERVVLAAPPAPDPAAAGSATVDGFVGRERETGRCLDLLGTDRRVTIVGPPGVGKTRLAREIAAARPDTIWCSLEAARRDAEVGPLVATRLGVGQHPLQSDAARIAERLRARPGLLVLDNVDHVVVGVAELLAALDGELPEVEVLVTSREALAMPDERLVRLAPFAPVDPNLDPRRLASDPAIRLMTDVVAALDGPPLERRDLPLVAEIARRLDGLPLALELAAAVLAEHGVRATADSVVDRVFSGAIGSRQRITVEAALDWTTSDLDPEVAQTFLACSVFPARFGPSDLDAVVGSGAAAHLAPLAARSLLVADSSDGGMTYRLLAPLREAARTRLGADELRRWTEAHARHTASVVRALCERMMRGNTAEARRAFAAVDADIAAALDWFEANPDPTTHVQMAADLWFVWYWSGRFSEGRRRTDAALSHPAEPTPARGDALAAAAFLAWVQADYGSVRARIEEALALEASSTRLPVRELCLATLAWVEHDLDEAERWLARAHGATSSGDDFEASFVASMWANVAWFRGEVSDAADRYLTMEVTGARTRNDLGVRMARRHRAYCQSLGGTAGASALVDNVLAEAADLSDPLERAQAMTLGAAARVVAADVSGRAALEEGFEASARFVDAIGLVVGGVALAELARLQGRPEAAALTVGWLGFLRLMMPLPMPRQELAILDDVERWCRAELGDDAHDELAQRGSCQPPTELLTALSSVDAGGA